MVQLTSNLQNSTRLITIPVSHYCEKARWALARSQIPYIEERHMPPFHRLVTQRVGGKSAPVLITETAVFTDSTDIVRYVDQIAADELKLYPTNPEHLKQVEELEELFNYQLAPSVRQWAYFYAFTQARLIQYVWCQGVPWIERIFFPILFPWLRSVVFQMYEINSDASQARERIYKIFTDVGNLLADGQTYLVGDRFSAADLTFITLAAPTVMPSEYGVKFPALNDLPSPMVDDINAFRETTAGKFVLRLYYSSNKIS